MLYRPALNRSLFNTAQWSIVFGVAVLCWIGGTLALLVPFVAAGGVVSPLIWPPTGIAVAAVWRFGKPAAIGVAVAAAAMAYRASGSIGFSALLSIGSLLPPFFVYWSLRRDGIADVFGDPRAVLRFSIVAGLGAPMLSTSVGIFAYWLFDKLETSIPLGWLIWWASEVIAVLLIAPTLLSLPGWRELEGRRRLEITALAIAVVLFWWLLFFTNSNPPLPLSILAMPLMIALSLRFNFSAVSSISLLLAIISIISKSKGFDDESQDPYSSLFYLHLFLGVLAISSLVIAAGSAAMRHAFEQIRNNEELFRAVFEQAAVGFMVRDLKTNTRLVNQKLSEQLGYSAAELPEPNWDSISHPADVALTHEYFAALARGETTSKHLQKRYIRKDGSLMWADITLSVAYTGSAPQREPHYSILVLNDITRRKRTETQLQGQTRILQSLTANAPLPQLLEELALFAEELWPAVRCAIYLADHKADCLRFGAAPSFPNDMDNPNMDIPIVPFIGVGCTPVAAARNETVIAADTLIDPLWENIRFIVAHRPWQRACWATPFASINGEMLGVITLYFSEPGAPNDDDNELIRVLASVAGIVVQRHNDAHKLREREELFRGIFEQAAVGVVVLAISGDWLEINQQFCEIVGYSRAELLTMRYRDLVAPEDFTQALQTRAALAAGALESYQAERCYIRKDGARIWVTITSSLMRDEAGQPERQLVVIQDISERKIAEAEIERLALYDYLTELPNRRLFSERLQYALTMAHRSGQLGALLYVDLDNFKQLNDTHGHSAGDELLKLVSRRLQELLREQDTVARLGGDEFIILLQDLGDSIVSATVVAEKIARKIQSAFESAFMLTRGIEHTVSASLGVTLFPKNRESAEDLLKEADIAMYRVKTHQQRNAIQFYAPEMQVAADLRLALERDLRIALQREQFQLFLQPQINAQGITSGFEALLRWPHPEHGLISPAAFIPIAEETGLIVPLGEWVIKTAAKIIHRIESEGLDLTIAVNVSPRQFREANFIDRVRTLMWDAGAYPGLLILEITEGIVVTDFAATSAKMIELKRLGIRFSIDDFGTGHSSLSYLKRLPIHELKIDRSFIADLPGDANDVALVEAILSVARHLHLSVVAEGVETAAQLAFLKQHGCAYFQGYHIGHPLPAADYLPFLNHPPRR